MRKSLIVSAVIAVSTLFAGVAMADEGRGVERPTVQNLRAGRNVDAAERLADKIRERHDRGAATASSSSKQVERKLEKHRNKGEIVGDRGRSTARKSDAASERVREAAKGERLISSRTRPKGDVVGNNEGNRRSFTIANDRKGRTDSNGPRTIVDVMKRKELLSFLGAVGVKINCSQTGTCTEETPM